MNVSRDASLEALIGRVLRTGVGASTVCLAIGLVVSLVNPGAGNALLNVGIVVLILTPAARVVLSIVEYATSRDWTFTLLTTIVLLELVGGAIAAMVFHKRI
jgi:uncharacterized membrane protein